MKLPYGYDLTGEEIVVNEERANIVRSIFEYYGIADLKNTKEIYSHN